MSNEANKITGYILAGGKSSRMGSDKGLIPFHGDPLVLSIITQVQDAVNKTVIVSNNPEYQKFGLEVIADLIQGIGPAGGIYSALQHTKSNQLFIASCDMPFVTAGAIRYMIQQVAHSQITLPLYKGKIQPLFGVYSKDCQAGWKQLIDRGIIKLQEMVKHFELQKIDTENDELFKDQFFTNINDKTDFEKALKYLNHGS